VLDAGGPRRLILAYLIVALAAVALVGALIGSKPMLGLGGVFAYLFAMIHAISFMVRARKRRDPAALDPLGRRILAATLAAMAASALGNLVTASLLLQGRADVQPNQLVGLSVWMVLMAVLCWRAWIVPSARRAAILQLVSVIFAVPSILTAMVTTTRHDGVVTKVGLETDAVLVTGMFVAFAVVCCAGPVLDRLFADTPDKDTTQLLPEAILRG
jgi:hypothetical protein